MEAKELIRIDFDSMENSPTLCENSLGIFVANSELSAHGVMTKWFASQAPIKPYIGWNSEVYPKYKIKTHNLKQ